MTSPGAYFPKGFTCVELKNHDPEPLVQYRMMTGSAGGWGGQWKFAPRDGYCQDSECYDRAREAREAEKDAE